jgi:hypothetical protein
LSRTLRTCATTIQQQAPPEGAARSEALIP